MGNENELEATVATAVVAERLPLLRLGLAQALAQVGVAVVAERADLAEALRAARAERADLLLLGDVDGWALDHLRRAASAPEPATRVVAVVGRAERAELVELLGAGVAGVVLRSSRPEELGDLARKVLRGERVLSAGLLSLLIGGEADVGLRPHPTARDSRVVVARRGGPLTEKELQVLACLAEGRSNQEIASVLYVSQATVKTHLGHIYAKLGVNTRHGAVSRGVALGLLH